MRNDQNQHQKTIELLRAQLEQQTRLSDMRQELDRKKMEEKDNQIKELMAQQDEFELLKPNLKLALERMIKQIDESGRECIICNLVIKQGQKVAKLNCNHDQFHHDCIDQWLNVSKKPTCPLCQSENAKIVE